MKLEVEGYTCKKEKNLKYLRVMVKENAVIKKCEKYF